MAGAQRYLLNRNGRFFARLVVPKNLRTIVGKTELRAPLGPDRRTAMKLLASAVASLQAQITQAERKAGIAPREASPITTEDFSRAIWQRYSEMLAEDEQTRARYPTPDQIKAATDRAIKCIQKDGIDHRDELAMLDAALEVHVLNGARDFDQNARMVRLDALRRELTAGETHQVEHEIDAYLDRHGVAAPAGSAERITLAKRLMRAEIEALERTLERDRGNYSGKPADPIVKPPATATEAPKPVSIGKLWTDYIKARQVVGSMKDGGKRGKPVIESLRVHLGHDDASKITKKDLLAWRDKLLETLGAKTVSSIYLSAVRSLLEWAVDNDRLSENPAATVKQPRPKRQRSRDPGYSDKEATAILKTSRSYEPPISVYGHVHERQPTINAKRWAPILCAFSGARIGEITQLRKQDVFQEGDRWIMRITPEAGTVKAGGYRDIPLHRQVIAEGFIKFVEQAKDGPLFSTAKNNDPPAKAVEAAAGQLKRLAAWLHELQLVPEGIQPNHAWRHRFKTQARNVGADSRVVDAIQGHAGRTAGDDYGDVSLIAKARVIDALPDYNLKE